MSNTNIKKSIFSKLRNNFIAGIVVLIPIGITLYLTLFLIRISGKIIPKEINPNNYLPFDIPGVEILIALIIITLIKEGHAVPYHGQSKEDVDELHMNNRERLLAEGKVK